MAERDLDLRHMLSNPEEWELPSESPTAASDPVSDLRAAMQMVANALPEPPRPVAVSPSAAAAMTIVEAEYYLQHPDHA